LFAFLVLLFIYLISLEFKTVIYKLRALALIVMLSDLTHCNNISYLSSYKWTLNSQIQK